MLYIRISNCYSTYSRCRCDKKKPKKNKHNYITEEPVIKLVKSEYKIKKLKEPKNNDFIIDEPVIKLVENVKDKKPNKHQDH